MAWPSVCPTCLSRHEDIHGMIYLAGAAAGIRCEDDWHKGSGYDPEELNLTDADRAWLKRAQIKI